MKLIKYSELFRKLVKRQERNKHNSFSYQRTGGGGIKGDKGEILIVE